MASRKTPQQYQFASKSSPLSWHGILISVFSLLFLYWKIGVCDIFAGSCEIEFIFFLCGCTNGKNIGGTVPIVEKLLRDLHWKNPCAKQPIVPVLFPFSTEKHQAAFSDFTLFPACSPLTLGLRVVLMAIKFYSFLGHKRLENIMATWKP